MSKRKNRPTLVVVPPPAAAPSPAPTKTGFHHTPEDSASWIRLYADGRWDDLSTTLLGALASLAKSTFLQVSPTTQAEVDEFVSCFLFLMTRPEFTISERFAADFIKCNPLIGNVVAMSVFRTTDASLALLGRQSNNLVKMLALYSARNTTRIERSKLFDVNSQLASLWYSAFYGIYHSTCCNEESWKHLREHVAQVDPRWTHLHQFHHVCFAASYIDPERDRHVKFHVNRLLQTSLSKTAVVNKPNPRRIAVITNRWFPTHSVYRNQFTFLQALRPDYDLVLFHLGPVRKDTDASLFEAVHEIGMKNNAMQLAPLHDNDFIMAYYPEVGMCMESILLSNLRIAPLQVTSYGHSVSTFGSDIDYWIGGGDVEQLDRLEHNYSERVVVLPGLGIANVQPSYTPRGLPTRTDRLIVNCSWYPQKLNWPLVGLVKRMLERSPANVLFRFFSGGGLQECNHFLPFLRSVTASLGTQQIEIVPGLSYTDYMVQMEQGALSLDAYHYGGCNTVIDSLHLRKPIISLSGSHWYNRIGGGILRKAGFPELVAYNTDEYVTKSLRLINDTAWREELTQRLRATDIESRLYNLPEDGRDFRRAVDYLVANHEALRRQGSKKPIFLEQVAPVPGAGKEPVASPP